MLSQHCVWLRAGRSAYDSHQGQDFPSPHPLGLDRLSGRLTVSFTGYRGPFSWGMKCSEHEVDHQLSRTAVFSSTLAIAPSWCGACLNTGTTLHVQTFILHTRFSFVIFSYRLQFLTMEIIFVSYSINTFPKCIKFQSFIAVISKLRCSVVYHSHTVKCMNGVSIP
jgi:hypothetical protein